MNNQDSEVNEVNVFQSNTKTQWHEDTRLAMTNDPQLAWSWHCAMAMSFYDAMRDAGYVDHDSIHKTSNEGAARFMKMCFNLEVASYNPANRCDQEINRG